MCTADLRYQGLGNLNDPCVLGIECKQTHKRQNIDQRMFSGALRRVQLAGCDEFDALRLQISGKCNGN